MEQNTPSIKTINEHDGQPTASTTPNDTTIHARRG